jgi:hypothetical protein
MALLCSAFRCQGEQAERAMHASRIVASIVEGCLKGLHLKRAAVLQRAVTALVAGGVLSLSALALRLTGTTALKHRIKSVDRLLGNAALHRQRAELYTALAQRWLVGLRTVLLVVDWSDATRDQRWQWLRASVVVEGRSVTLYEEVHPQQHYAHPRVHRRFLARLATILPAGCIPIVMTDAGFQSTWFQLVSELGWSFVGRIRGRAKVCAPQCSQWVAAKALYAQAQTEARDLGPMLYVRSNPTAVRLVLARRSKKARRHLSLRGRKRRSKASTQCARREREPWLLAASPNLDHLSAQALVALYAQRMRIEQTFRDTKNLRVGLGLEVSRSKGRQRLEMLLLIAHLASFVQRLIGEEAKTKQLELRFMATRRATRPEISVMTLGRRLLNASGPWPDRFTPWEAIPRLTLQAANACLPT